MHSYAQTYPQLFNQLRRLDYSKNDLSFIRDAYEVAMVLFSGRFQPSGRVFMAHVIGTASILAWLRLSPQVIAAGLVHNAYTRGDFGDGRHGPATKRRKYIRQILGTEVEEYLARFPSMWWYSPKIQLACRDPRTLDALDRNVLLICIADELEHLCNLELLYYSDRERQSYLAHYRPAAEWAESLGMGSIVVELGERLREIEAGEPAVQFSQKRMTENSFVTLPKSQKRRFAVRLQEELRQLRN